MDKARADEFEQRAMELEQKVSDILSPHSLPRSLSPLCPSLVFFSALTGLFLLFLHPAFFIEDCGL